MGIFDWLLGSDRTTVDADAERTREAVERIVELSPQLRLANNYQARLSQAAKVSLEYVGNIVDSLPGAREASVAAWSSDAHIHAFFATPDDVAGVFSRAPLLRAFFEAHYDLREAFALLSMAIRERRVLGARHDGELVCTDVARTTISFSDHQVGLCARTEADLRHQLVLRVVDQLTLAARAQIEADASRRDALEEERALLKARLALLGRGGLGMSAVLGSGESIELSERDRLQARIQENERSLKSLGLKTDALEREIRVVCDVLAAPASHLTVVSRQLRLDRMNVVAEDDSEIATPVEFRIARVSASPPRIRAVALVRVARADLLPSSTLAREADPLLL